MKDGAKCGRERGVFWWWWLSWSRMLMMEVVGAMFFLDVDGRLKVTVGCPGGSPHPSPCCRLGKGRVVSKKERGNVRSRPGE